MAKDSNLLQWACRIPKLDLHRHMDGAIRPETIVDLARKANHRLPTEDPIKLRRWVCVSPRCRSLTDFLKTFEVFYPLLRNPDAMRRIAVEMIEDCAKEGTIYVEGRFAPILQANPKASMEDIVRAVLEGMAEGERRFGIAWSVILCCYRSESPASSVKTVRLAEKYRDRGVGGIDLAGDELRFPARRHRRAFALAREAGVPITVHAGESKGTAEIREALFELGAQRLGHGTRVLEDPQLVAFCRDRGILLEVCLTSNVQTGVVRRIASHPLREFLSRGLTATLCTDDPAVSQTDLAREVDAARRKLGFGASEIRGMFQAGLQAAFCPKPLKRRLKERLLQPLGHVL